MVVIAILGLTVFDRQGGYSTTAIVSVVIGNSAAVVGLILGFLKAYLASERDQQAAPTAGMH
jgi:hypothetical protein